MTYDEVQIRQRVYVRELDVYGSVQIISYPHEDHDGFVGVSCEPPMPGFNWVGHPDQLERA